MQALSDEVRQLPILKSDLEFFMGYHQKMGDKSYVGFQKSLALIDTATPIVSLISPRAIETVLDSRFTELEHLLIRFQNFHAI